MSYRGSRKHILDWVESPHFRDDLNTLLKPSGAVINADDTVMPAGKQYPREARLETFGPVALEDMPIWPKVRSWWLAHEHGANTPNWDLAATCTINGRRGIVLIEAKANYQELKRAGKGAPRPTSPASLANHTQIQRAIAEARSALSPSMPTIGIDRDTHYQLSNRIAFAWRLASLDLPVVLVYLGFIGDKGIKDAGEPFATSESWTQAFTEYAGGVFPTEMCDRPIDCSATAFWLLVRSRPILEESPPKTPRAAPIKGASQLG